jgi:hypothetical protein
MRVVSGARPAVRRLDAFALRDLFDDCLRTTSRGPSVGSSPSAFRAAPYARVVSGML